MVDQPVGEQPPEEFWDDEEEEVPLGFRILFEDIGDLTKTTETPPRMVLPVVRLRVIDAAYDPTRAISLQEFFVQEFDRRMISVNRKGRMEAVHLVQSALSGGDEEEEGSI